MQRRRLRLLVAKTPVVGIILSVATLYGLWLVATATTVPEYVSATAKLTDDGLFVADFPVTLESSSERLSIVDGNGQRREAMLFRREGVAAGIRVWARPSGSTDTPEATMEVTVSERSLLSYAVAVLFRRDP